jgi:DNA polymerase-3 subunit epsilon
MPSRPLAAPRQRPIAGIGDELEIPLRDVTFCAVDLETTSVSSKTGEIIEIGALKARGGEILGTFETFVQPSVDLPVEIQLLTGITPSHLVEALPLPAVLPAFVEFSAHTVFVAHNARFDRSFLDAACRKLDYEDDTYAIVDTARLARRLLRDEVRNCRLQTLAAHFHTPHKPIHRAFADAAACLEVLWSLLERASAYGVTTLADLLHIQSVKSNPHFEKVKLARSLPRERGVYLFENIRREVVYVGKAANLRSRVRSYFASDERKRMGDLRAEVTSVRVLLCETDVEASALEARLIERYRPRYNRAGIRRRAPVYLKLTNDRHPRFATTKDPNVDGATVMGPFSSTGRARAIASTLSGLFGLRTCTLRLNGEAHEPCALYDLGSCHGPCTAIDKDVAAHDAAAGRLREDLRDGLRAARLRLASKLGSLAEAKRFEEAAGHRDAFDDLVRVIDRAGRLSAIRSAGRVLIDTPGGPVSLVDGLIDRRDPRPGEGGGTPDLDLALPAAGLGERQAVGAWLERADDIRLVDSDQPLAFPWPRPQQLESIDIP